MAEAVVSLELVKLVGSMSPPHQSNTIHHHYPSVTHSYYSFPPHYPILYVSRPRNAYAQKSWETAEMEESV